MIIQLLWPFVLLLFSIVTFYLVEGLYGRSLDVPFSSLSIEVQRANIFIYYLAALVLYALLGKLHPFDLLTIQTAMNVADNYDFSLGSETIRVLKLVFEVIVFEFICRADFCRAKRRWVKRGIGFVCFCGLLVGYLTIVTKDTFCNAIGLDKVGFRSDWVLYSQGVAYNFAIGLESMHVDVPAGYREKDEEELLASYVMMQ